MKSKVLSYPSFEELVFPSEMLKFSIPSEEINEYVEGEMRRIAKKNGKVIDTDSSYEIMPEDIVMIRVKSSMPKFNKPMIPVTVGKGLYDLRLEEAIVGMKSKEKKVITIDDNDVEVEILKVKTKDVPELTVDMVKEELSEQYPEVCDQIGCIDDFRELLTQDAYDTYKMESYYNGPLTYMRNFITSEMDVDVCEDERDFYRERILKSIERDAMAEGVSKEEYMKSLFGNSEEITDDNLMEKVYENIEKDFLFSLYARQAFDDISDDEFKAQYEIFLDGYSKEANIPREDLMKEVCFDEFVEQNIVMNAQNKIFEKYMEELEVE